VYSPVSGEVVEINNALVDEPAKVRLRAGGGGGQAALVDRAGGWVGGWGLRWGLKADGKW
jgi:hypothetical protein